MKKTTLIIFFISILIVIISCDKNLLPLKVFEKDEYGYSNTDKIIKIKIELPQKWRIEGNIFYNDNNEKIGEFSPGIIYKKDKTIEQIKNEISEEYKLENSVISIDNLIIKKYEVLKITTSNPAFGGNDPVLWEPNKYIINYNDKYYLNLTFYNRKGNKIDENVINDIINSIKIYE